VIQFQSKTLEIDRDVENRFIIHYILKTKEAFP